MSLRIPPIILLFIMILGQIELSHWWPLYGFEETPVWVSLIWCSAGSIICLFAVAEVRRNRTTIDPRKPENVSALVTGGIYKYSRNPMYLGMVLFLVGSNFYVGDVSGFITVLFFVFYMVKFQIRPEENILLDRFGNQYDEYRKVTRQWL